MVEDLGKTDQLRYRLLGPVTAYGEGGVLSAGAPKLLAVLAVLLLHPNQVVSEEQLFDLVWGGGSPRSAKGRVRVYISELRAKLGHEVIDRIGGGYRLNVAPGQLDVQIFTDAVAEARSELQAGNPRIAAQRLRTALALWTGPALSGVSKALAERKRPGLVERRIAALEELFEAELADGQHDHLADEIRQARAESPFHERFTAQLMLALHRAGRTAEALLLYTETHRKFVDELGVEPSRALRDMQLRILSGDDEVPRLVTKGQPLAVPGADDGPERVRPHELPRVVHGFIGRDQALAALDAHLVTPNGGVQVISGPAGVGKTALAVHWAHHAKERFPDGQLYVNLRGYDPEHEPMAPVTAMCQLLRSLGVSPDDLPHTLDEQAALYRALLANRRLLVLLDNARDTTQVLPLLPPGGSVVVTSRHRLTDLVAQVGAHVMSLGALTDQEANTLLRSIIGADRVAAEASATAELSRVCARLPLALRIAAANLKAQPLSSVAVAVAELTDGDLLASLALDGAEDSPVAVAFSASYHALTSENQRVFRLLGLIPGPDFSATTVSNLTSLPMSKATRCLRALATVHLIEQHGTNRYRLHDLVRLYAARLALRDPERASAWARLIDHYLAVALAATDHPGWSALHLPRQLPATSASVEWSQTDDLGHLGLDAEIPNLVAAAPQAATRGPYPAAWFLVDRLDAYFQRQARRAEWLDIAPRILQAAREKEVPDVQALLHKSIGSLSFAAGLRDAGAYHTRAAIRIAHDCGWRECEAEALADLGVALTWTGNVAEAAIYTQKATELFSELGSTVGLIHALSNLGNQSYLLGQLERTESYFRRVLALSEEHELHFARGIALLGLGSSRVSNVNIAFAENALADAREIFERLGSNIGLAWTSIELGRLLGERGNHERAYQEARHALNLAVDTRTPILEILAHTLMGETQIAFGQYASAEENLHRAVHIGRKSELPWHLAEAIRSLARLHMHRGDYQQAVDQTQQSLDLAREYGYKLVELDALVLLVELHERLGNQEAVRTITGEALALNREIGLVKKLSFTIGSRG